MHFLTTIGIILALIGIVLISILKSPLKISDKLLIAILTCFVIKFLFDEAELITGNLQYSLTAAAFGISTIATCGWYIKYLTGVQESFGLKQLAIYLPIAVVLAVLLPIVPGKVNVASGKGYLFILGLSVGLIIYYFYFCIKMLQKHKQLILQNYSGVTGSITINWMVIIISLQIAEFVLKGLLPGFADFRDPRLPIVTNEYCFIIETFLLVVLGVWQKSVPVFLPVADDAAQPVLQADDLERYRIRVERFMEHEKPYLDPELTIEKLSELTRIKKLTLSQTLNKSFNKNFFTFIKEYRIRHVEDELKLRTDQKRTIMDVAYASGFNSKTGFNRAFKEVTGKTPTEYLEETNI
jgi:AraC-like DNA-binding protein